MQTLFIYLLHDHMLKKLFIEDRESTALNIISIILL